MKNDPCMGPSLRKLTRVSVFFLLGLVLAVFGLSTESTLSAQAATTARIPTAITDMEDHAEDIYDAIFAMDCEKAIGQFRWFRGGVQRLDTTVQGQMELKVAIHTQVDTLGTAINERNRPAALAAANQIAWLAAQMTVPYHPVVPIAIARLDYDGRELQVAAASNDMNALQSTAADIRTTWGQVRPQVVQRGGSTPATRFDQLVTKLGAAQSVADYTQLAVPILDEVDNLERVFTKK